MAIVTISLQGDTVSSPLPHHSEKRVVLPATGFSALLHTEVASPLSVAMQAVLSPMQDCIDEVASSLSVAMQAVLSPVQDYIRESTQETTRLWREILTRVSADDLFDLACKRGCSIDDLPICEIAALAASRSSRLSDEDRRIVELFNATYQAEKRAGIIRNQEEWMRRHNVFCDVRWLRELRARYAGTPRRARK